MVLLNTGTTTSVLQIIRGIASQTADLQQWQNSAGTVLASINSSGYINSSGGIKASSHGYIYTSSTQGSVSFMIADGNAAYVPLAIKGVASQTANLTEWQNSSGTVLVKIDSTGKITSLGSDHYFSSGAAYRPNIHITNTTADSNGSYILFEKSRAGSAVVANDVLGVLNFTGFDTTTYAGSAIIYGVAEGTFSPTSRPGKLVFATVPSGSTTMTDRMTIANSGTVTINGFGAGSQGLIVKGAASQTANLQEWQDSAGTVLSRIDAGGNIVSPYVYTSLLQNTTAGKANLQTNQDTGAIGIYTSASANKGLIVRGATSQTANLTEWQNSAGTVLASVDAYGTLLSNWKANIISGASYLIPLVVKAAASQTANLQEWQNSSGTVLAYVEAGGHFGVGNLFSSFGGSATKLGYVTVSGSLPAIIPLVIRGAASQTANLQEWQNSAGTVTARFTKDGEFSVTDAYVAYFSGASNYSATLNVQTADPTYAGLVIRGKSAQTGDLQKWQNSAGTVLAKVAADGQLSIGNGTSNYLSTYDAYGNITSRTAGTNYSANISVLTGATNYIGMVIRGLASQTADLQQWQNSSATVLASISSAGKLTSAVDASINGLTFGLGASAVSSNVAAGSNALATNSTGSNNSALGYQALYLNTTGAGNSAFGYISLTTNTSGYNNSAFGTQSLTGNTTGINNTAIGAFVLKSNTTGSDNSSFGINSLYTNTTGAENTAIGANSLYLNTIGIGNSAFGKTLYIPIQQAHPMLELVIAASTQIQLEAITLQLGIRHCIATPAE